MKIIRLKINKHYLFCFFLLFVLPLSISSQRNNNIKAKEWLYKSSKVFEQIESMSIYFTIKIIRDIPNKASENFDGQIDLEGNKFHLTSSYIEIWYDGKNQWILYKELEEVNITQPTRQDFLELNPINIFNEYKKNWKYKDNGRKKDLNKNMIQEIELVPQQTKNKNINKIIIQINPNDSVPIKIHVFFKNKIENIICFNKYKKNVHFPNQYFSFDKSRYPNVGIVDLR